MKLTLILSCLLPAIAGLAIAGGVAINFDKDEADRVPQGFSTGLTGKGKPGN